MAKIDHYSIKVTPQNMLVLAAHLRRGVYEEVQPLIADIGRQVDEQNHAAEQRELQEEVAKAGLTLVEGDKPEAA